MNNRIEQVVGVSLNELIDHNLEGFLDLLEALCQNGNQDTATDDSYLLEDISYEAVGVKDGLIEIKVVANKQFY